MTEEERIQSLEKEILAQAEARVAEAVERAERIATRVARNAQRKADEIRREAEQKMKPRIEGERARAVALAELEMKRRDASEREQIVETAFARAREELASWRSRSDRDVIIKRLIVEGVSALPGAMFSVECASEDAESVRSALESLSAELSTALGRTIELKLSDKHIATAGGVRVTSDNGRSRVDQTFEARLDRLAPDLRRTIHHEVFGDGATTLSSAREHE